MFGVRDLAGHEISPQQPGREGEWQEAGCLGLATLNFSNQQYICPG